MRGKELLLEIDFQRRRITPAYAGKSSKLLSFSLPDQDHPRLCGEKGHCSPQFISGDRITPAYAGKSIIFIEFEEFRRDHPRLCGEKASKVSMYAAELGSPPPMRGKGASWKCLLDCKGITPAYAGKSTGGGLDGTFYKDHPRLCGEKIWVKRFNDAGEWITPAYAGKSTLQNFQLFAS